MPGGGEGNARWCGGGGGGFQWLNDRGRSGKGGLTWGNF